MGSDPVVAERRAGSGPSAAGVPFEAILLAAGESRRMGYPKPLLKLGSRTFIEILAAAMLQSVARLIVVVGAHADAVRGGNLTGLPSPPLSAAASACVRQNTPGAVLVREPLGLRCGDKADDIR